VGQPLFGRIWVPFVLQSGQKRLDPFHEDELLTFALDFCFADVHVYLLTYLDHSTELLLPIHHEDQSVFVVEQNVP